MTITVAYPGRDGAHAAVAAEKLFPTAAETRAMPSFSAVAEAAASGEVAFGVLPIESSLAGPVNETHDLLFNSSLSIIAETVLPITHCLVGLSAVPLEEIRVVRSHPVALDQCRRLLAAMPWATAVVSATTADGAKIVADNGDVTEAAIASEQAAERYGLTVIADDVGDHSEAYTRFVSVATYTRLDRESESWRTAFSFITAHHPGALHEAIEPFGRHRIDLVQLVSRPIPPTPWRYRFDAVLAGHPLDPIVNHALAEVGGRTRHLKVFGSYPTVPHERLVD
jgi:chorismate mutase / prephenate dehydratase